ncbi:MAG: PIN domain-containing protein [Gemmatimonadaceae bacterium]
MRVLFDANVVLDVLLARAPHAAAATTLFVYVARKSLDGLLCATTLTTIFYLAAKASTSAKARRHVRTLVALFDVAVVTRSVVADALEAGFKDFEDAALHEGARQAGTSAIVTRNPSDFAASKLQIYSPAKLLRLIRAAE